MRFPPTWRNYTRELLVAQIQALVEFLLRPIVTFDAERDSDTEGAVRHMLYYALVFLIVGLIAGALGIYGVAAIASQIAWVLFLVGIVLLVIHLVSGRSTVV
jgi:uncharacterized membrane protein YtjA (UPF0391 family)